MKSLTLLGSHRCKFDSFKGLDLPLSAFIVIIAYVSVNLSETEFPLTASECIWLPLCVDSVISESPRCNGFCVKWAFYDRTYCETLRGSFKPLVLVFLFSFLLLNLLFVFVEGEPHSWKTRINIRSISASRDISLCVTRTHRKHERTCQPKYYW